MSNTNPQSIRQICLKGFLAQEPRETIAARIKELHPNSKAAEKSTKHIAWHYGDMKKAGLLDAVLEGAPTSEAKTVVVKVRGKKQEPAAPSEADLIAAQAAELAARVDATL